jgi:hypothetical protein
MSKCDVTIAFARPERNFVGDESVDGTVVVRAKDDFTAKKITLKCFWETHGRGNRDSDSSHAGILEHDIPFRAGEERRFPFRLRAPHGPPTYHGTYLNVDHYVEAEVDLAWSKNPKDRQDFLLRAGPSYEGPPTPEPFPRLGLPSGIGAPSDVKVWKGPVANTVGCGLGAIFLVFVLLFFFAFWPVVIVLGGVGAFFYARHRMVRSRVGKVEFSVDPIRVEAGDACAVRLAFRAEKATQLNAITVRLVAQEICTSGSGTNRTTRTQEVVAEEHELRGAGALGSGEQVDIELAMTVPDRDVYSFEAKNNKLRWIAEARIDIPGWPDWTGKESLVVLQPVGSDAFTGLEPGPEVAPPRTPPPVPDGQGLPPAMTSDLEGLLAAIQATDRYSDQRDALLAQSIGIECVLEVRTHTTEWTSGFDDDGYRDGRSIVGTLAGTSIELHARFPKRVNSAIDAVTRDDHVRIRAIFKGWDRLLDRAEFDVLELEGHSAG